MWERGDRRRQQHQNESSDGPPVGPKSGMFRFPKRHAQLILLIVVMVVSYYQPTLSAFFAPSGVASAPAPLQQKTAPADREGAEFMTTMMATLAETWQDLFQAQGLHYQPPTFIIYRGAVNSRCQPTRPAAGIFYCRENHTLYLSLDLYDALKNRPPAESESILGYMIAHTVGHHVQTQLSSSKPSQAAESLSGGNRQQDELQADCFAGLWGHRMVDQQILTTGDWQPALKVNALVKVMRDRHSGTALIPEDFTYATAAARYQYFNQGFTSGELKQCLKREGGPATL